MNCGGFWLSFCVHNDLHWHFCCCCLNCCSCGCFFSFQNFFCCSCFGICGKFDFCGYILCSFACLYRRNCALFLFFCNSTSISLCNKSGGSWCGSSLNFHICWDFSYCFCKTRFFLFGSRRKLSIS